jgi:hypothetical protein
VLQSGDALGALGRISQRGQQRIHPLIVALPR